MGHPDQKKFNYNCEHVQAMSSQIECSMYAVKGAFSCMLAA